MSAHAYLPRITVFVPCLPYTENDAVSISSQEDLWKPVVKPDVKTAESY